MEIHIQFSFDFILLMPVSRCSRRSAYFPGFQKSPACTQKSTPAANILAIGARFPAQQKSKTSQALYKTYGSKKAAYRNVLHIFLLSSVFLL
jgi:hypothetical protein